VQKDGKKGPGDLKVGKSPHRWGKGWEGKLEKLLLGSDSGTGGPPGKVERIEKTETMENSRH